MKTSLFLKWSSAVKISNRVVIRRFYTLPKRRWTMCICLADLHFTLSWHFELSIKYLKKKKKKIEVTTPHVTTPQDQGRCVLLEGVYCVTSLPHYKMALHPPTTLLGSQMEARWKEMNGEFRRRRKRSWLPFERHQIPFELHLNKK